MGWGGVGGGGLSDLTAACHIDFNLQTSVSYTVDHYDSYLRVLCLVI